MNYEKNRKKIQTVFTIGLILLLGVYLLIRNTNNTHYRFPAVPKIDTNGIDRITISATNVDIQLSKSGTNWMVMPGNYDADMVQVNDMLIAFQRFKLMDMVSEAKNYGAYDLDENTRILVAAYRGDQKLTSFYVGKPVLALRNTFIRLPQQPEVYSVPGNLRLIFEKNTGILRYKNIFPIFQQDMVSLRLKDSSGNDYLFLKGSVTNMTEKTVYEIWTRGKKTYSASEMGNLMEELANLNCDDYISSKGVVFGKPVFEAVINGTNRLTIYSKQNGRYPAASSAVKDKFWLADWRADTITNKLVKLIGGK